MCSEALKHRATVSYLGFDVFDSEPQSFHDAAFNGKGFFRREAVARRFDGLAEAQPGLRFTLHEGRTDTTLHDRTMKADFVFIDGDHRVDVIRRDFEALRGSNIVVFDDYYDRDEAKVNPNELGCNVVVEGHKNCVILPGVDRFDHVGAIKMAALIRPHFFLGARVIWLPRGRH